MSEVGTNENPLRVAIVGAGPTGFYAAEHLYKHKDLVVEIDMFDRLPTPYGLVRAGVAPDHQKIKSVTKVFARTAKKPGFRFFGNVEMGRHLSLKDLQAHYHQIIYCTGAQTDRYLDIPGADLQGHHPATEFVAWYNGHPDFRDYEFDLSQESAAVIGIGNVAMDVARILCRTRDELAQTDIADYALEALANSNIKKVYILGRRGPAQAKFTTPEIKELGEMEDADIFVLPEEAQLDPLSEESLAESADRGTARKVQIIQSYADNVPTGKSRELILRFLVSPTEMFGDADGQLKSMRLVHNELYATGAGTMRPRATDRFEDIDVGLVFRSVGYRGVALPGVPFNDSWGVILNADGRVIDPDTKEPVLGQYTAGWIKRGPSGVIGTNKPDALETVRAMLEDLTGGRILDPDFPEAAAAEQLVHNRQPDYFTFADWEKLDEIEVAKGYALGRPRLKFTSVEEMLAAIGKQAAEPVL
ncbi:MAG: FAD-dependent oxidoreductase [Chloroflexi bacterium]|jgi:ferredoxin--NADP+ reductase|nr:FAD-dependent oxidoreductase [Chloroflexota bacterium]